MKTEKGMNIISVFKKHFKKFAQYFQSKFYPHVTVMLQDPHKESSHLSYMC